MGNEIKREIKVFKLLSGEEIIAHTYCTYFSWTLEKPRAVIMAPGPQGTVGVGIVPWIASNVDGTFKVNDSHIITTTDPNENLKTEYLQQTTGIQLVK